MKTGTTILPSDDCASLFNKRRLTVIFLCLGYFIDFYDLTVFSASYVQSFRDLFHMRDNIDMQRLYLYISSIYTFGIFMGAVIFGVMSDKFGRSCMIRYSILLYSVAIIASVFCKSVWLFTTLRFITGLGLASEFATSSVLINELFPAKRASLFSSLLYFGGVLGGLSATYLGSLSWKTMYIVGGVAGIALFMLRKKIYESFIFLNLDRDIEKGSLVKLFNSWSKLAKFFRLLILIVPFNFIIVIMFILPRFMNNNEDLALLTKKLLLGFFVGNLISSISCNFIVTKFKDFRVYLLLNIFAFIIVIMCYKVVAPNFYMMYTVLLGLLGGGLPTVWIQLVVRSYGTNIRSTASNTLFATGRLTSILFNLITVYWLSVPGAFHFNVLFSSSIIFALVVIAIVCTKNNYGTSLEYIE